MRVNSSRTLMTPHEESQFINEGNLLQNGVMRVLEEITLIYRL
jgi:hypothetical protein